MPLGGLLPYPNSPASAPVPRFMGGAPAPGGSTGPASAPSANLGEQADALSQVREAIRILEGALPKLPMGEDAHKAVLNMITTGAKIAPASAMPAPVQMTTLDNLRNQAVKTSMLQALMRAGGNPGAPQLAGATPTPAPASTLGGAGMAE